MQEGATPEMWRDGRLTEFIERFAGDLAAGGMPRMGARVFACLLASEEGALTSRELTEQLHTSPASVSSAVGFLSQVQMISRERTPGSRRERYRVHEDVWFAAYANRGQIFDRWRSTLEVGLAAVHPDSKAGRRIRDTSEFFLFMKNETLNTMERWHEHRAAREEEARKSPPTDSG